MSKQKKIMSDNKYRVQWTAPSITEIQLCGGKCVGDNGHELPHSRGKYVGEWWTVAKGWVTLMVNNSLPANDSNKRHIHITYFENGLPVEETDGHCWQKGLRIPK